MEFHVITLFPEMFESPFRGGMVGRAIEAGIVVVTPHPLRPFGLGNYRQVDDQPYGGGSGMVMRPEPIAAAIDAVMAEHPALWRVLMTPQGEPLTPGEGARARGARTRTAAHRGPLRGSGRTRARDGRSGDIDRRLRASGGELPAMVVIEAVTRLIPGVLGNPDFVEEESFSAGLLEYPQYTRPEEFRGAARARGAAQRRPWQDPPMARDQARARTEKRRPDLWRRPGVADLFIALIHHPVLDRKGRIVTSAITSLDIHDLARSARTYGVRAMYIVHPIAELREFAVTVIRPLALDYGAPSMPSPRGVGTVEMVE